MHSMVPFLPNELVLEIIEYLCAHSQADYRSCLLLSRPFYQAIRFRCLRCVPIHLYTQRAMQSFAHLLGIYPDIAPYVRHLWTVSTSKDEISIVRLCTNLVSLACHSVLLASICSTPTFKHTSLRELTIMTIWSPWQDIIRAPHGSRLCSQVTHLRHFEGLPPDFPTRELSSLKRVSFASYIYRDFLLKHLSRIADMPNLQSIVITTTWYRVQGAPPEKLPQALNEIDKRLSIVHCERGFSEREVWCERARLGKCLWNVAHPDIVARVGSTEPNLVPYPC